MSFSGVLIGLIAYFRMIVEAIFRNSDIDFVIRCPPLSSLIYFLSEVGVISSLNNI